VIGEEIDPIFHLATGAIELFVKAPRLAPIFCERGADEARIGLTSVFFVSQRRRSSHTTFG
jgi:hypothetical protein